MAATWLPLESNPDVLTKYLNHLGVSRRWSVTDVIGLDPELLEWIPRPVKAFILLFPITEAYEQFCISENDKIKANQQIIPTDLFYMKQVIHNACGTIALVHSIANNKDIQLDPGGILGSYLERAYPLSFEDRGKLLEHDAAFTVSHQNLAHEGQTTQPGDPVNHHFIALVNFNGYLYELDGRKSFPIQHGRTNEESFVHDAAAVCKAFMARDPKEVRFNIMAIVPSESE